MCFNMYGRDEWNDLELILLLTYNEGEDGKLIRFPNGYNAIVLSLKRWGFDKINNTQHES